LVSEFDCKESLPFLELRACFKSALSCFVKNKLQLLVSNAMAMAKTVDFLKKG
jgi:hypothetical protein